jgi:uncharacterized protein (TIGR00369 family)
MSDPWYVPPTGGTSEAWVAWANALPHSTAMGLVCNSVEPGRAQLTLASSPWTLNPSGSVHGGLILAAVDQCMGIAVLSRLELGQIPATATLQSEFHRPAKAPLRFEAVVTRLGRTLAFVEVHVYDRDERLCVKTSASFSVDGTTRSLADASRAA